MSTTGEKTASLYGGYADGSWQSGWSGRAYQGEYSTYGQRIGSISIPFGTTLKGTEISKIVFTITFASAGLGTGWTKTVKFWSSKIQTFNSSTAPSSYKDTLLGSISTVAYGNTATITIDSSNNSSLFSALKTYFEAGNTLILIYNDDSSRDSTYNDFTKAYLYITAFTANVTYSPKYTLTVSKGTGISAVTGGGSYASGTKVALTATLSTGYNFNKWTSSDTSLLANSSTQNPTITMPAGAVTYTASGTLKTYTISYKKGTNGSGTEASDTKTHGTNITLKGATFTRTGYTQTGWSTTDGGSQTYDLSATYSTNAALTLYPVWTANTYTVSYNANGGSGTMANSTATYNQGFKTTANAFTRVGYTFAGWNESADGTGVAWGISSSDSGTAESGNSWTWTYTKNITLYAVWTVNSYTLTVNKGDNISSVSGGGTKNYNASCSISATPSTGYKFTNWTGYSTKTDNPYAFNMPASNVTYTANAEGISYTVVYHGNGGTGTMTNSSHTYGTTSTLSKNAFAKTGYSFQGWSTSESSSSVVYADEANASALSTTDGATINLYAVWEAKSQMFIWTTKQLDGTTGTTGRWARVLKYAYNNTESS